ncbi:hypothetical protein [Mycolicibacterium sarraceniae]|uniref:hypothetical protein n=1 Tax=Mycolicibacterium sarraceniae TaxID=1534348 RepID=UPI0013CFEEBF|nr:hypothetical protein [Mycolicibacterium sarraceniae]
MLVIHRTQLFGPDKQKTSPTFFDLMDFVLGFAPALASEQDLRAASPVSASERASVSRL